jgi:hypothetical protein
MSISSKWIDLDQAFFTHAECELANAMYSINTIKDINHLADYVPHILIQLYTVKKNQA